MEMGGVRNMKFYMNIPANDFEVIYSKFNVLRIYTSVLSLSKTIK
jgi:hypothetical protein